MGRSIEVSGSTLVLQLLVAGSLVLFGVVAGANVLALALETAGYPVDVFEQPVVLGLLVGLWLGLTGLWVRTVRRADASGSYWGFVPEEQYAGRFAGSGGLARKQWERSLRALPRNDDED